MILALLALAANLDTTIEEAIAKNQIPGAVVQIGQPGKVIYRKAYGNRALVPAVEPMSEDTIFDAASLTKVITTTSCVMKLFEAGRIRLSDPVTAYLPEFQGGKSAITIRNLLTHYSGLRPDLDLKPEWSGYETGIKLALIDKPVAEPGEKFIYSDINFILLGEIVRRISGKPLPEFAREQIFEPVGMTDTMFRPTESLRPRIAPTEQEAGMALPLRGIVHDPTTRYMNGVAGHAGMFTTAADLGRFAEMMLGEGEIGGKRIFSAAVVRKFIEPGSPFGKPDVRGLGWDLDSRFSANRGELFPFGSFGHTGFTGTSIWMDPSTKTYVVLLANSVHPNRRPPISSLRSRVATIAAAEANPVRNGEVFTGLDVLASEGFARLRGKRVGLITNHTGLSRDGKRNVDLMIAAGVNVTVIFAPEHGISGRLDQARVDDTKDAKTGIAVASLYKGEDRKPSAAALAKLDLLVFDIQDIGTRFYTFMCTLVNVMEEAGKLKVPVIVLDRPNPITGTHVEGPMLEDGYQSFVGCFPMPLRHGMTMGEIARMINTEQRLNVTLEVVAMRGWQRTDWFDSTGLTWVDPSPNMKNLSAALVYPGVAMLEYAKNYSVGRGTDSPFEQLGAPWIDGRQLANYLNRKKIAGVRFYPVRFQPASATLRGQMLEGVKLVVTERDVVQSTRVGLEIAAAIQHLYPGKIDFEGNRKLIGNSGAIRSLAEGEGAEDILAKDKDSLSRFQNVRKRYLLY